MSEYYIRDFTNTNRDNFFIGQDFFVDFAIQKRETGFLLPPMNVCVMILSCTLSYLNVVALSVAVIGHLKNNIRYPDFAGGIGFNFH